MLKYGASILKKNSKLVFLNQTVPILISRYILNGKQNLFSVNIKLLAFSTVLFEKFGKIRIFKFCI